MRTLMILLAALVAAIFSSPAAEAQRPPGKREAVKQVTIRELRSIHELIERARSELALAEKLLLDIALSGAAPVDPPDDPPADPPADPPRDGRWDAASFEAEMLAADRSSYTLVGPHGGGSYSMLVSNSGTHLIQNRLIEMGTAGILGGGNGPTDQLITGMRVSDCEFTASPSYDGVSKWGMRLYNTDGLTVDGVYFHDFGPIRTEHGLYVNPVGSLAFRNVLTARIGGQMLQATNREEPGSNKDLPDRGENSPVIGGRILVERFVARDCGMNEGRGSFPISLKDCGRPGRVFDVTIRDGLITSAFPEQLRSGRKVRSTGGILVNGSGKHAWHNGTVIIENVVVDVTQTDRSVLQVNNCAKLIVRGCTFKAHNGFYGDVLIDRTDGKYGDAMRTGEIVWEGNTGNVNLRVGGETIGPVDQDFRWPPRVR